MVIRPQTQNLADITIGPDYLRFANAQNKRMRSMIQILHILEIQHNHRILNGLFALLCIVSNPSKCIQNDHASR